MRSTPRSLALVAALALALTACGTAISPDATPVPDPGDVATDARPSVRIDGADLVLVAPDGGRTTVATVTDGDLVHATVRPGGDGLVTVLALARDPDGRYALRYLDVLEDGTATDLYGFPWRLQVDPDSASHADVPTVPVWAPDGDAIAWLEFDAAGTRLRTLTWLAYDTGTNPGEDGTDTAVDVPVGAQLTAWDVDDDGVDVLLAEEPDGGTVRIRLTDAQAA